MRLRSGTPKAKVDDGSTLLGLQQLVDDGCTLLDPMPDFFGRFEHDGRLTGLPRCPNSHVMSSFFRNFAE